MKGKIFAPAEANRMLPLVASIAEDIVATYADVNQALQAFQLEETKVKRDEAGATKPAAGRASRVSAGHSLICCRTVAGRLGA